MRMVRWAATTTTIGFLLGLAGCEQKPPIPAPPGASGAAPAAAASSQPTAEELKNLGAFARNEMPAGAAQQAGDTPPLPAGHPPVPGVTAPAQPAAGGSADLPSGHPPIDGSPMPIPPPPPGGELRYAIPEGWQPEKPGSTMRKAQWILPRAEGDDRDGEMVLFFFGPGQGGDVEGNITRWRGMFSTSDGKPIDDGATRREVTEANGLKITLLEFAGRYAPSMMPGAPASSAIPNARMLAAIVEGPGGPWFFRGVGPEATMVAHRDAFVQMMRSAKP